MLKKKNRIFSENTKQIFWISHKHDVKNQKAWVAIDDLAAVNPCSLKKTKINGQKVDTNKNPYNPFFQPECGEEGFENLFKEANLEKIKLPMINFKNKPIAKIFNTGFGILLAYLLYKILKKEIKLWNKIMRY